MNTTMIPSQKTTVQRFEDLAKHPRVMELCERLDEMLEDSIINGDIGELFDMEEVE